MSLRWRIMGSIVFVILLTVLASAAVGYYATQHRLGVFVDRIGVDQARQLAQSLSGEYTSTGSWETVDRPLSEAGYVYDEAPQRERHEEGQEEEGQEETEELFHRDPVRVVITGADGVVLKDNLSRLPPGAMAPDLDGRREMVFDLNTDQPVGQVYVDVDREFLSTESHGFLITLLYITVTGGLLTAGVAILLAAWLSKRITAPVTALTEATQAIAQGDSALLPVTSRDELGRMSEAFNRMTTALETQRELRRRLIDDLSHELNTPLSVIQLEAGGLRDGLQSPENASQHITQEVGKLRGLVTDLNWLAETDHGELRLTLEGSSVYELLDMEVERWQPESTALQVELSLQASPDLPQINIDRMRMSQALGNLIKNAVQHTQPGGQVVVRAELEGEEALVISVIDDGTGIDAADRPHVFERFYRSDQSHLHGIAGTGLGLAITKAIVEAHGGTVAVASGGPGQGAVVTCRGFPPSHS